VVQMASTTGPKSAFAYQSGGTQPLQIPGWMLGELEPESFGTAAPGCGSTLPRSPGPRELLPASNPTYPILETPVSSSWLLGGLSEPHQEKTPVLGVEKWQGRVLEINDDIMTTELTPLGDGPTLVADFDILLLDPPPDGVAVVVGDFFYLTVRTVARIGGKTRTSSLRPKRVGHWTPEEIEDIGRKARSLRDEVSRFVD
jgi:hypothetical protein